MPLLDLPTDRARPSTLDLSRRVSVSKFGPAFNAAIEETRVES